MNIQNQMIKTNMCNYSTGEENSQIELMAEEISEIYRDEKGIEVIRGTGEILQDISSSGRPRNWSEKKGMNRELVEVLKLFRNSYPLILSEMRLNQIEDCATYLKYGISKEGSKKLVDANFCRFKFCPICVWRKSLKMFSQMSAVTEVLSSEYPSARYIFVTFTVKNVRAEELSLAIDRLNEGFKRLVQKSKKFTEAKVFQESLLGYLKCLEITYNSKEKSYHPHIHSVFHLKSSYFGKNYLSHSKWVSLWKAMMNLDYEPLVNVKAIKRTESGTNPKMIAELAKYPIKTSDLLNIKYEEEQQEVLYTLLTSTYHRRFVTFGGTFREMKRQLLLDDIENGDLVHVESESRDLNFIAYELYRYDFKFGCYIC